MPLFGSGGTSSGSTTSITPETIPAAGTTRTLDQAGEYSTVKKVTLDQTACAFTLAGLTTVDGKYREMVVVVVGSTGKSWSISNTVTYDDGNQPVQRTSGTGQTAFLAYTLGDGNIGISHGQRVRTIAYGLDGTGVVAVGKKRFKLKTDARIVAVDLSCGTAPTGATFIVDVNINGTSAYTTQGNRPAVAISGNTVSATLPDTKVLAPSDYLTFDVDQVGSTIAGGDWTVQIDVIEAY